MCNSCAGGQASPGRKVCHGLQFAAAAGFAWSIQSPGYANSTTASTGQTGDAPRDDTRDGALMNHTPRPTTPPPLYVIRREVAEHFAAVDRATRDLRVSRAGFRSIDQSLSDRMSDVRRRLDTAHSVLKAINTDTAARAAAFGASGEFIVRLRPRREGSRPAAKRPHLADSPRQPRLRLYSPTSPV